MTDGIRPAKHKLRNTATMSTSFHSLSLQGVNAISWVCTGVALALTGGRYFIRWKLLGGFRADDMAHLVAVTFMLAQVMLYSASIPILSDLIAYEADPKSAPMPNLNFILAGSTADGIILVSGLWSVKFSYMLLYRQVFDSGISKTFSYAWWSVMAFNVLTYLACLGGRLAYCGGDPRNLLNWSVCQDPANIPLLRDVYIWMYVSVVTSDIATMALPLYGIRDLQMRIGQKITIAVVLCLSFVTIAFETLRLAESFAGGDALNTFWQNLELEVAVIVSALPVFYSLLNRNRGAVSKYTASKRARLAATAASSNSPLTPPAWTQSSPSFTSSFVGTVEGRDSFDKYLGRDLSSRESFV